MSAQFLHEVILIIIAAFLGGFAARTLRLHPAIGYITSGVVFGIVGKNVLHTQESLMPLSEIGVTLLLFTMGFEVSFDTFKKINPKVFLLGISLVIVNALILFPLLLLFHFPANTAFLFATLGSFSSTVVIVKILQEKGALNNFPGNQVFIFLLIQDLFVVPVIFMLPLLYSQTSISPTDISGVLISLIRPIAVFITLLILGKLFLNKALEFLFKYPSHELTILASICVAAITIGLLKSVGLPDSLAAFLAGILISQQGKNLAPLSEMRPIRDILLVLFFVVNGMLIDLNFISGNVALILMLTVSLLVVKFLTTFLLLVISRYIPNAALYVASHLTNVGEFAVIVGQLALIRGYITGDSFNVLLSVFVLSLFLLPFQVQFAPILDSYIDKIVIFNTFKKRARNHDAQSSSLTEISDHVILCGHGRMGREVRHVLDLAGIPYIVIDFDKREIRDITERSKYAIYGDSTDDRILHVAGVKRARAIVISVPDSYAQKKIAETAKGVNPTIFVISRAHSEKDKEDLHALGVQTIIFPELEAGRRIGDDILVAFGFREEDRKPLITFLRNMHIV